MLVPYAVLLLISCTGAVLYGQESAENEHLSSEPLPAEKHAPQAAPKKKPLQVKPTDLLLTPSIQWKKKPSAYYDLPETATHGVKGSHHPYMLWYDQSLWEETTSLNEHAEKSFRLKDDDDDASAIIVVNKNKIDLADLGNIVIKNAKENGFEKAMVLSIEKRKINGNDGIFMHWQAVLKNEKIDFLSFLYSDSSGSVFIHSYTPSKQFEKNSETMETFLNGFTVAKPADTQTSAPHDHQANQDAQDSLNGSSNK